MRLKKSLSRADSLVVATAIECLFANNDFSNIKSIRLNISSLIQCLSAKGMQVELALAIQAYIIYIMRLKWLNSEGCKSNVLPLELHMQKQQIIDAVLSEAAKQQFSDLIINFFNQSDLVKKFFKAYKNAFQKNSRFVSLQRVVEDTIIAQSLLTSFWYVPLFGNKGKLLFDKTTNKQKFDHHKFNIGPIVDYVSQVYANLSRDMQQNFVNDLFKPFLSIHPQSAKEMQGDRPIFFLMAEYYCQYADVSMQMLFSLCTNLGVADLPLQIRDSSGYSLLTRLICFGAGPLLEKLYASATADQGLMMRQANFVTRADSLADIHGALSSNGGSVSTVEGSSSSNSARSSNRSSVASTPPEQGITTPISWDDGASVGFPLIADGFIAKENPWNAALRYACMQTKNAKSCDQYFHLARFKTIGKMLCLIVFLELKKHFNDGKDLTNLNQSVAEFLNGCLRETMKRANTIISHTKMRNALIAGIESCKYYYNINEAEASISYNEDIRQVFSQLGLQRKIVSGGNADRAKTAFRKDYLGRCIIKAINDDDETQFEQYAKLYLDEESLEGKIVEVLSIKLQPNKIDTDEVVMSYLCWLKAKRCLQFICNKYPRGVKGEITSLLDIYYEGETLEHWVRDTDSLFADFPLEAVKPKDYQGTLNILSDLKSLNKFGKIVRKRKSPIASAGKKNTANNNKKHKRKKARIKPNKSVRHHVLFHSEKQDDTSVLEKRSESREQNTFSQDGKQHLQSSGLHLLAVVSESESGSGSISRSPSPVRSSYSDDSAVGSGTGQFSAGEMLALTSMFKNPGASGQNSVSRGLKHRNTKMTNMDLSDVPERISRALKHGITSSTPTSTSL